MNIHQLLVVLLLVNGGMCVAQDPPSPNTGMYCLWVLDAPPAWPPCAGGMRSRIIPYVSSMPGCEPTTSRPLPMEETEACSDVLRIPEAEGTVTIYLTLPYGTTLRTVVVNDSTRQEHGTTRIGSVDGVGIYR